MKKVLAGSQDLKVDRERILERVNRRGSPLVALLAPVGYGKSETAQAIAQACTRSLKIECKVGVPLAAKLGILLGAKSDLPADILEAWQSTSDTALIIDNVECLGGRPSEIAALRPLMELHPKNGRVIFCGSRDPGIDFAAKVDPHMITILRREHLSLNEQEMHKLFAHTNIDDGLLYRLYAITGGWPIPAMYCVRIARSGDIEELFEGSLENAFEDLIEYVDRNVVTNLPEPVFRGLCTVVGIPAIRPEELDALYPASESAVSWELTRHYQVASARGTMAFDVNGLLRCTMTARHHREIGEAQRRFGEACRERREFGRAAQAYLSAGDIERAESFLQSDHEFEGFATFDAFSPLPGTNEIADLVNHPKLWAAVLGARRLSVHPSVLANEATAIFNDLDERTDPLPANTIRAMCAVAYIDAGMIDQANAVVGTGTDGSDERYMLPLTAARAAIDSYLGAFDRSLALWHKIRPHALHNGMTLAQLTRLEIRAARARGQWEVEYEAIERMLSAARESQAVTIVAMALAEGIFGAWLAQEEDPLEAYRTELRGLVEEHELPGLLNLNLAAHGLPITSKNVSTYWDTIAHLLASANETDPEAAARLASAAVLQADASSSVFLRVLARVAIAEKLPSSRQRPIEEAIHIAASMESPALQHSLKALLAKARPIGILEPFVNRLRLASGGINPTAEAGNPRLNLGNASIWRNGVFVNVAPGGWGLLAVLGLEGHAVHRDVLCDRLWPNMSLEAGYNALKMCVRRTRLQLQAPDAIVSTQGGYALGSSVEVDLTQMERLHAAITNKTVGDRDVVQIETYFATMREGRPAMFSTWEWFAALEQRLESIGRQFGQFLCERAIAAARYPDAIEIAEYLVKLDSLDETARSLLITALVGAGDRATAVREYRYFEKILKDELGVETSIELRALLDLS